MVRVTSAFFSTAMIWLSVNRDLFTAEPPHFITRNSTFEDHYFAGGLPWHGRAEACIERLREALPETSGQLQTRLAELIKYLLPNKSRLINYGARYRNGLPIASSLAESAVNFVIGERFKKKGQMRWTPKGANALLHVRVADLNGELDDWIKGRFKMQPSTNKKNFAMAA